MNAQHLTAQVERWRVELASGIHRRGRVRVMVPPRLPSHAAAEERRGRIPAPAEPIPALLGGLLVLADRNRIGS